MGTLTETEDGTTDSVATGSPIDAYVVALGVTLRRRGDRDDILAETADHLWLTAERLVSTGVAPLDAERAAVERFGDPEVLARVWATVPSRHRPLLAAPAAVSGLVGAAALAASTAVYQLRAMTGGWDQSEYLTWSSVAGVALLLACAPLLSLLADADRRGLGVRFAVGAAAVALAATWFVGGLGWAWPVPGLLVSGVAVLAVRRWRDQRVGLGLVAAAWPLGTLAYVVGDALHLGPVDYTYLQPILPPVVGFWIGATLMVAGVVAVARTLLAVRSTDRATPTPA
ncbi:hypothetical protein FE697_002165 [Mumia zhuanghuii]|uniref:Permease prefix domain 1-containing protein n=2 Tax=Mumia TaxID=1546255 RepID=A0ABW1QII0_9ACTN|nr:MULTISPECIES: permease prefix domain 1-containing protein [Mumia]KAA1424745.1 hypothetical protein FE697_002165 [Mumia zhuanghuii]